MTYFDSFRLGMGYCCARSPESGRVCQRKYGHDDWHANAGAGPGDERVWTDDEMLRSAQS